MAPVAAPRQMKDSMSANVWSDAGESLWIFCRRRCSARRADKDANGLSTSQVLMVFMQ
jgi:hypothetical protein